MCAGDAGPQGDVGLLIQCTPGSRCIDHEHSAGYLVSLFGERDRDGKCLKNRAVVTEKFYSKFTLLFLVAK